MDENIMEVKEISSLDLSVISILTIYLITALLSLIKM